MRHTKNCIKKSTEIISLCYWLASSDLQKSHSVFQVLHVVHISTEFLSLQCYALTEYKFTCACLSVCVYVTLSVNLLTGQTPQRIFTVDSLKDADLRKDVPFGSLDDEWSHLGVQTQSPPKPLFWGLNRHFKPNMRKIQIAKSSDQCISLTWNLTGSCGQQQRLRGWSRIVVIQFQDGGRPLFWKSIYRHIAVKNHQIFMKFCTQQQSLNWMNVCWSKIKKLHWTDSQNVFLVLCNFHF